MRVAGERAKAAAILLALVLLAILYVMAIGPYWKISPDSVSYVSAAVSLASGQGYNEAGKPVILFPPVTSLMFCIAIMLFPGSYLALNAVVAAFALLAHAAAFVLLRKQVTYVLTDKKKEMAQRFLLPAIKAYPDRFTLIQEEEDASFYEFKLQP